MVVSLGDNENANAIADRMLLNHGLNEVESALLAMLLILLARIDDAIEYTLSAPRFSGIARYLKMFERGHSPILGPLVTHSRYDQVRSRMERESPH